MTELIAGLPGPLLVAVIALGLVAESGLLIGVAIPGTAIALAAGVAAQAGVVPVPAALAGTALGAVLGGQLAYRLGRRRRHRSAPFAGVARVGTRAWPSLCRTLRRRPFSTVLVAPWLSAGRLLVPRTAGWSGVEGRRFTAVHTPSAIAWAATLTGVGYAATALTREYVALGLGLAAGTAVLLGVALVLRGSHRRTPTGPVDATSSQPVGSSGRILASFPSRRPVACPTSMR